MGLFGQFDQEIVNRHEWRFLFLIKKFLMSQDISKTQKGLQKPEALFHQKVVFKYLGWLLLSKL